ncbi:hypothetical protein VNO77_24492 [Canavalia gladiata]|uniref:Uncharacterized protein n=1 Tax=Canavalia gladiata TaxID=3824 RepID=A0AAN9QCN7_CANGL
MPSSPLGLSRANTPHFLKKASKGPASGPKQGASVIRSSPWRVLFSSASTASNPNACFLNTLAGSVLSFNGGFSMSLRKANLCLRLWLSALGAFPQVRVVVLCRLVNLNADCELELCRVSDLLRFGHNLEISE